MTLFGLMGILGIGLEMAVAMLLSIMRVNKIQFFPNVKDEYFLTRYLKRF